MPEPQIANNDDLLSVIDMVESESASVAGTRQIQNTSKDQREVTTNRPVRSTRQSSRAASKRQGTGPGPQSVVSTDSEGVL